MVKILLLLAGGAIGTLCRYALTGITHKFFDLNFPLGTLFVNVLGSFIIGFIWGLWEAGNISSNMRVFIFIGLLGGFTTFSSFALETMNLIRGGEYKFAIFNFLGNNVLGLLLVFAGFFLAEWIVKLFIKN